MRTTSMRVVAAIVATSLGFAGTPPALAQTLTLPSEQTPLEHSEQPMPPAEPPMMQAPPVIQAPEPAMAQAQPVPVQPPPPMPPAPAMSAPPAPPQALPPAMPDVFQETLKAQQRSADRKQGLYEAGAVVTNIFLVPGRAITCVLGSSIGVALLALSFGTGYKAAASAFDEGCGGRWVVTGDDLKPDASRAFEWER